MLRILYIFTVTLQRGEYLFSFLISSIHFIAKYNISLLHYLENNGQIFIRESTVLPALWTSMFDGLL